MRWWDTTTRLRPIGLRQPGDGSPRQYRPSGPLSYAGLYVILTSRFPDANHDPELATAQVSARHADPRTTKRAAHAMNDLDDNAVDYVTC